jgi:hypothetical protein
VAEFTLRERKLQRWGALKLERSSWINRWMEITQYLLPFSGRYFSQDRNRGDKNFNSIYDSTATRALRILSAGMMAGMTSPARPWFRLATPDPDLMELEPVKLWLNNVTQIMRDIFARGNTYRALHTIYEELGAFATATSIVDNDFDHVIWHNPLTAGEYAISTDSRGKVDTLYREFEMTVAQLVEKFVAPNRREKSGSVKWDNVSHSVKTMWDTNRLEHWVPVLHAIEPRAHAEREYGKRDAKNMAWRSCYIELNGHENKVLRESGYEDMPVVGPRWHTRGGDVYGNGVAMEALGDIKQLQQEQLRKGQAIDYMTLPPIGIPGEMKSSDPDTLPGGVTYMGAVAQGAKAHNLFDVNLNLEHLLMDIQDVRHRIYQAFYADLFLMISNDQRRQPVTAREIAERHEEKLLMLGPTLERLHDEMLSPLIDLTFAKMVEAGMLTGGLMPPPEMHGMDLKVEFVSMLAQAQKAVGLGSVDRLLGTVVLMAQGGKPEVLDKVDADQVVDKYAEMLAIDPTLIVADEKVGYIRAERQKAQAAQAAAAMAPAAKDAATAIKTMSEVNTEGAPQFSGYSAPEQ